MVPRVCSAATASHIGAGTSANAHHREALFHAAHETYIRKWHGQFGWAVYRVAAFLGAGAGLILRGPADVRPPVERGYICGAPVAVSCGRVERYMPRVSHIVVTAAFAGVERYVCAVATATAERGLDVTVIGGDPARMPTMLGAHVRWEPGSTILEAIRSIVRSGRIDGSATHI